MKRFFVLLPQQSWNCRTQRPSTDVVSCQSHHFLCASEKYFNITIKNTKVLEVNWDQRWSESPQIHIQTNKIKMTKAYLVDGWRMLWPRSWGFLLWVLIASGRMAGVICCTSALLLKFLHLPVHSVWGGRRQKHIKKKISPSTHLSLLTNKLKPHLSISFCTSSMCSIASCCSFSKKKRKEKKNIF